MGTPRTPEEVKVDYPVVMGFFYPLTDKEPHDGRVVNDTPLASRYFTMIRTRRTISQTPP